MALPYLSVIQDVSMEHQERPPTRHALLGSLSDSRRRSILRLLQDRASPMGEQELATNLVAEREDKPLVDVNRAEVKSLYIDLIYIHLPNLTDADLVEWDREAEIVTATDHPALSTPEIEQMIAVDAPGWDAVLGNLAHRRRRVILSVLEDREDAIGRNELAKEVVAHERSDGVDDRSADAIADLVAELHHVHLPKLEQADLLTYDTETGAVRYEGHPALVEEWLQFRPDGTSSAIVPTARNPDDIWTIEGRDNVIARGQSLFEQADDELFLMVTTDGLLEDGCIRRLQDAVERGVDIYLGSQTQRVRDIVRERVPEAVIWEPQMDWLNLPPEYEKVGRLVFADRKVVMLATIGEETDVGFHEESAITGSGKNNPLVVLMREMLGSRLDHLDAQSEDFLSKIPL